MSSGAHTDFKGEMSYADYLALDRLLDAQHPRSGSHDELLFITIHQASELWLKLALHELEAAIARVGADDLSPAFKMTARVTRIFAVSSPTMASMAIPSGRTSRSRAMSRFVTTTNKSA